MCNSTLLPAKVVTVTSRIQHAAIYFQRSRYCCKIAAATVETGIGKKASYYPLYQPLWPMCTGLQNPEFLKQWIILPPWSLRTMATVSSTNRPKWKSAKIFLNYFLWLKLLVRSNKQWISSTDQVYTVLTAKHVKVIALPRMMEEWTWHSSLHYTSSFFEVPLLRSVILFWCII